MQTKILEPYYYVSFNTSKMYFNPHFVGKGTEALRG